MNLPLVSRVGRQSPWLQQRYRKASGPPSALLSTPPRFGLAGGMTLNRFLAPGRMVVTKLENDPLLSLAGTDICGMVLPRSYVEYRNRGVIPAQETFIREILATVSNVFLSGWLGSLALWVFMKFRPLNPKAMNHRAWIDTKTLGHYEGITRELLANKNIRSARQLQEAFLKTVFSRLESTDPMVKLTSQDLGKLGVYDFSRYYPDKGRLSKQHVDTLVQWYMHGFDPHSGTSLFRHQAFNVEELVAERLNHPEHRVAIREAAEHHRPLKRFKEGRDLARLSHEEQQLLARYEADAVRQATQARAISLRREVTRQIRSQEGSFFSKIRHFLMGDGKLSEHLHLMNDAHGKPCKIMATRPADEWMRKTKYFIEEYLNPALADPKTGRISQTHFDRALFEKRLLPQKPLRGWRRWIPGFPRLADDLITYTHKSKFFLAVLPVILTVWFGVSVVIINNLRTRLKTGSSGFPGEEALLAQERQKHLSSGRAAA